MSIKASGIGFIGRKKELKHLWECLKKGQNVAIIAPRRFGKTSLIAQALKQLKKEDSPTAIIDLFSSPTAELLSESLDFPDAVSEKHKKGMICVYEDMGNIQHMDQGEKIAALLKAKLRNHSHTSYIFSACHLSDMEGITGSGRSALLKKENIIQLDLLNKQELVDALNKKFSKIKLKLPRHYLNDLVKLTKGHPYYTQQAIHQLILSYVLEGQIPKQKELPDHLLRLEKDYLELTWEAISRNREYVQILLALPSGSTNIYPRLKSKGINVARAQKKLEEMGMLKKNEQAGYTIADPLLELWIQKKLS